MIDVCENTKLLSLTQATKALPPIQGKRLHPSTVWRWCRVGVRSRPGRRVYLEHVRVGARVFTTADAINAFVAEVASADGEHFNAETPAPTVKPRTPRRREKEIEKAEAELAEAGI